MREDSQLLLRAIEQQGAQTLAAIEQQGALTLRAIEQTGQQQVAAIERMGAAQRDGFRSMADAMDRVGDQLEKQIAQTKAANGKAHADTGDRPSVMLFIALAGLFAAIIGPMYMWVANVSDGSTRETSEMRQAAVGGLKQLQEELHTAMREGMQRDEVSIADRRALKAAQVEQAQKLNEIETQFRAMWMMIDAELQQQDRINSFLWNYQHKDMPWEPRRFFPAMGGPPQMVGGE
jgi:hypothetical protein